MNRALISVSDKSGVVELARGLQQLGIEIISTGGTAKVLRKNGVEVKDASEITGFPEMLDGRVKTLHPKIHGGILAIRGNKKHVQELKEQGVQPIDLVVVNLYPFEETIKRTDEMEEIIENIDIGGPAMLRSAAKNYRDVAVIVDPSDYSWVMEELRKNDRTLSDRTREKLAAKAFAHTARYDAVISKYLGEKFGAGKFPETLTLTYRKVQELRYGENPHQKAALYAGSGKGIVGGEQLQGKQLSFNNILDLNAALSIADEFEEPTAVVIKHGNPCGVATGSDLLEAYKRAHACDPVSAYGGIVAVNRRLDEATAKELTSTFIEALVAPEYDAGALNVLGRKKNLRVIKVSNGGENGLEVRPVSGGVLVQERDVLSLKPEEIKTVTRKKPSEKEMEDLFFAWKVVKHVKSNAIVVAKEKQAIGVGAGQTSRVDSAEIAIRKAGEESRGAVLASDGFIPFSDTIEKAAEAGITAIIQPGGSIHDAEVIESADKHSLAMVFTGIRHFKH